MDIWKFFAIGHEHHVFCNPMSEAKFDEVIDLLAPARGGRALDIACGKGEFLRRLVKRCECRGVGVELYDAWAEEARGLARAAGVGDALEIVTGDAAKYSAPDASFDVVSCFGASWIWGGHAGTLEALARWTRPGGLVVAGEPFWVCEPSPEYLKASGMQRASFETHLGNIAVGERQGLRFLHSIVSNADDWDRYEGLQWYAAERHAHAHPDDPDNAELLAQMRERREHYLHWARAEFGWAVYLFLKP